MDESSHFLDLRQAIDDARALLDEADDIAWDDLREQAESIRQRIRLRVEMICAPKASPAQHVIEAEARVAECFLVEAEMRRKERQSQVERELYYYSRVTCWVSAFESLERARPTNPGMDGAARELRTQIATGYRETMSALRDEDDAAANRLLPADRDNVLREPVKNAKLRRWLRGFADDTGAGA